MGMHYYPSGSLELSQPLTEAQTQVLTDIFEGEHERGEYPSRYCPWELNAERGYSNAAPVTVLQVTDGECSMVDEFDGWLKFFLPMFEAWGIKLNGEIWVTSSDDSEDGEKLTVTDNVLTSSKATTVFSEHFELLKALYVDLSALNHAGLLKNYVGLQARLDELREVIADK